MLRRYPTSETSVKLCPVGSVELDDIHNYISFLLDLSILTKLIKFTLEINKNKRDHFRYCSLKILIFAFCRWLFEHLLE